MREYSQPWNKYTKLFSFYTKLRKTNLKHFFIFTFCDMMKYDHIVRKARWRRRITRRLPSLPAMRSHFMMQKHKSNGGIISESLHSVRSYS